MRGQFSARLATETDNEQLLTLARLCPIEAKISFCAERDPRFLALNELQGDPWFVGVVEDQHGTIVACGSIAVREVYIDGESVTASYAGDLRVAPSSRHSVALLQLYTLLWTKARELRVQLGHTSIVEGNTAARVLLRGHAGLPRYRLIGMVRVCAVNFRQNKRVPTGCQIDRPEGEELREVVALLNRANSRFNFSPVWNMERLQRALNTSPGLSLDCFRVARRGGRVIGVLAAWDQSTFQRTRVLAYPLSVAAYRHAFNTAASLLGFPRMPAVGNALRQVNCTYLAIEEDDPEVLRALLTDIHNEYRTKGYHFITFGMADGHRLLRALDGFSFSSFPTGVYSLAEPGSVWENYDFTKLPVFHEISHV